MGKTTKVVKSTSFVRGRLRLTNDPDTCNNMRQGHFTVL